MSSVGKNATTPESCFGRLPGVFAYLLIEVFTTPSRLCRIHTLPLKKNPPLEKESGQNYKGHESLSEANVGQNTRHDFKICVGTIFFCAPERFEVLSRWGLSSGEKLRKGTCISLRSWSHRFISVDYLSLMYNNKDIADLFR